MDPMTKRRRALEATKELAKGGCQTALYAYGRAMEDGFVCSAVRGKVRQDLAQALIEKAFAQGGKVDALERMYQECYRPYFLDETPVAKSPAP